MNKALIRKTFTAVLFDLDGVVTDTRDLHFRAWQQMFNDLMKSQNSDYKQFTEQDYVDYVDGKPRYQGVKSFLDARNITADEKRVKMLGDKKNTLFQASLEKNKVAVYESTIRCIEKLRKEGIKIGLVSSSKNCMTILKQTHLTDLFDCIVDGVVAHREKLKGKPHPDTFLYAANLLSEPPEKAIVVEDAISGIQAAKKGHFGYALGIDRKGQKEGLYKAGADLVVDDISKWRVYA
jgi:alpha,alpha-trehalase